MVGIIILPGRIIVLDDVITITKRIVGAETLVHIRARPAWVIDIVFLIGGDIAAAGGLDLILKREGFHVEVHQRMEFGSPIYASDVGVVFGTEGIAIGAVEGIVLSNDAVGDERCFRAVLLAACEGGREIPDTVIDIDEVSHDDDFQGQSAEENMSHPFLAMGKDEQEAFKDEPTDLIIQEPDGVEAIVVLAGRRVAGLPISHAVDLAEGNAFENVLDEEPNGDGRGQGKKRS